MKMEENKAVEALEEILLLIDEKILIRNISEDHNIMAFMKQGIRITNALAKAQKAISENGVRNE
ncbi:hypothetical protein LCGC14_1426380 [marine sediment metagenome]|uniref:Uncharacterized protein n=2 Tax=marine sediment metagenome TaxID=412755 RepID=A0A0F9JPV8_9ZZZZ